jgi:hypothetical protein
VISGEFIDATTAYDALPSLIRSARYVAAEHGMRVTITGLRSPRCGIWHYIAVPQPDQPLVQRADEHTEVCR